MGNGRIIAMVLASALCASSIDAAEGDLPRATGYRSLKKGTVAWRGGVAKKTALLRASKTALPSSWDSREWGWVSSVKHQGTVGSCWAFASYATLETQLLKAGKGEWDFSEKNMVNLHGWEYGPNVGGNYEMAAAYLLRWGGAVAETNDVYKMAMTVWTDSPPLVPTQHVQHVIWMEPLDGSQERIDALKAVVMEYGAVATSFRWNGDFSWNGAYYYMGTNENNHAVSIVGWDDDYPVDKFRTAPPGPGAWLIKNSWGTSSGDEGFYRISYHDTSIGREGGNVVFIPAGEGEDYDAVRGYDQLGYCYDPAQTYPTNAAAQCRWQASVFTAAWNERLDAVGVWTTVSPTPYEISIYTNVTRGASTPTAGGVLACRQTGTLAHAGFTTVPLEAGVPLADGSSFAVVYRQTGEDISLCINCTIVDIAYPVHARGNSYFGRDVDGVVEWVDGIDAASAVDELDVSWAACIKAYTRSTVCAAAGDAPGGADDGTAYLADLAATNAVLLAETARTFGASAGLVGLNGRSLWTSWLAGLDPSDSGNAELTVSISVLNGVPRLTWSPDLGDRRTYTIWGRATLDASEAWTQVGAETLGADANRFFRVSVDP